MNYLLNFNKFISNSNIEKIKDTSIDIEEDDDKPFDYEVMNFDKFIDRIMLIEKKVYTKK